jgi:hypothetical protein
MEDLKLKSELEPNTIRFDLGKSENEPIILSTSEEISIKEIGAHEKLNVLVFITNVF